MVLGTYGLVGVDCRGGEQGVYGRVEGVRKGLDLDSEKCGGRLACGDEIVDLSVLGERCKLWIPMWGGR